jgi:hypothetical protein
MKKKEKIVAVGFLIFMFLALFSSIGKALSHKYETYITFTLSMVITVMIFLSLLYISKLGKRKKEYEKQVDEYFENRDGTIETENNLNMMTNKITNIRRQGFFLFFLIAFLGLSLLWVIYIIIEDSLRHGNVLFGIQAVENMPSFLPLFLMFLIVSFLFILCIYWVILKRTGKIKKK